MSSVAWGTRQLHSSASNAMLERIGFTGDQDTNALVVIMVCIQCIVRIAPHDMDPVGMLGDAERCPGFANPRLSTVTGPQDDEA